MCISVEFSSDANAAVLETTLGEQSVYMDSGPKGQVIFHILVSCEFLLLDEISLARHILLLNHKSIQKHSGFLSVIRIFENRLNRGMAQIPFYREKHIEMCFLEMKGKVNDCH